MTNPEDVLPGKCFMVRQATNTISKATYEVPVTIVWVERGHVHYRIFAGPRVYQMPMDRFLDMIDHPPRAWR